MLQGPTNQIQGRSILQALAVGAALTIVSCLLAWAGVQYGNAYVPAGQGFPKVGEVQRDFFRFDSFYYLSIAESGYAYNGDPASSPNIVFSPLFPLIVRGISEVTGESTIEVGFVLDHLLLWGALSLLFASFVQWFGAGPAVASLLALVTSAGSYALHAYYSESVMLFFLALSLLFLQREWWLGLAVACAFLGASRTAALPLVAVFSALLLVKAFRQREAPVKALRFVFYGMICWCGIAAYLIYIGSRFGEPVSLISTIQNTSWGLFHQETSVLKVLTGTYLFANWAQALNLGTAIFTDIKALNLVWTTLALVTCFYWAWQRPRHVLTLLFIPYFAFVYWTGAGSDFLISAHRFFMMMLPIFVLFTDLHRRLAQRSNALAWGLSGLLLAVNMAYGAFHAAYFNQGVWYYF